MNRGTEAPEVVAVPADLATTPPNFRLITLVGPGLIVAATGIGSGDIVAATAAGANHGVVLLWAVAVGAAFKYVLTEGIARWQLATGLTAIEGWTSYLPVWVRAYFGLYLVIWTVAVSAALTNATGLGIQNLTGGLIPQAWGAVLHSIIGFCFVLIGGFKGFEKTMKVLVGIMGFSVLICAAFTLQEPMAAARGLLVPTIPDGSGMYVLSLIGGIGGSITILSYNYWMREERMAGPAYLRFVRADLAVAYVFTALFGIAITLTAYRAFFVAGVPITDAQAIPRMSEMLGEILGPVGFYAFAVGFWAAVFASLLGVWQSVPYLYADYYGCIRGFSNERRQRLTRVTSTPYRLALIFITLAPLPFAFTGRPILIIVTFTIISSLFIPFLAATLLYLNNRVPWKTAVPRNHRATNAVLAVILLLFLIIGAQEIRNAI
jgi:Mn2+/Fe2+ NRAMP family transporter